MGMSLKGLPKEPNQLVERKLATKIDMVALARDVEKYPDAYPSERAERFGVSQRGIGAALKRLEISWKKRSQRWTFQEKMKRYQSAKKNMIYLDESGFAHEMPRNQGDALRGQRCVGKRDWHARGRLNVVGALPHAC